MNQALQILNLLEPADYQAGSQDLDSVNMGKLNHLILLIQLGAITGNDSTIQLYAGATAGAKTTELGFSYKKSGADYGNASADVFGAATAVAAGGSGLVFTDAATFDHRVVRIDVPADAMPEGKPWLTVATDDGSASALLMSAVGIGFPRFDGATHPTAL